MTCTSIDANSFRPELQPFLVGTFRVHLLDPESISTSFLTLSFDVSLFTLFNLFPRCHVNNIVRSVSRIPADDITESLKSLDPNGTTLRL
jgi:hypothetical protein